MQMLPNMIAVDSSMVVSDEFWRQAVVSNTASNELTQQLQQCIRPLSDFCKRNLVLAQRSSTKELLRIGHQMYCSGLPRAQNG